MSATNRSAERKVMDEYTTPSWCLDRLLDFDPEFLRGDGAQMSFLEPCVGDGALIRAYQAYRANRDSWMGIELRDDEGLRGSVLELPRVKAVFGQDFLQWDSRTRFDVCLTNPPYSRAQEFVEHGRRYCRHVCMLLRLNFYGSNKRRSWLSAHMPDAYVLPNRPAFSRNKSGRWGTDATEYAWFHWDTSWETRRSGSIFLLNQTPKTERSRDA